MYEIIKNEMLDRMIRIYGYENQIVIDFAKYLETIKNKDLGYAELLVESHEKNPQYEAD